ncbi:MAG: AraC family transcriptional regulator [Cytophagales bacterium]|nr:AraC family transcriptional regulator [Cytophagales bacterium]
MRNQIKVALKNDASWLKIIASKFNKEARNNQINIPDTLGRGYLNEFKIEDGLTVVFGEMELTGDLKIEIMSNKEKDSINIFFKYLERGNSYFKPVNADYKEVTSGGVQFFSSNVENYLFFPADTHCFLFRVHATLEWIQQNLFDFINQNFGFNRLIFSNKKIMHFEPLTNRSLTLFSDVFKSEFNPRLNHLIVKNKGYEAVVLFFDHFYKQFYIDEIRPLKYSIMDQKRLYGLVDFIKANLHIELNLDLLAREVGFSKSKLQAMFHYFFHQSIYAFIKNMRLEKAVELLIKNELDIRQVAFRLGYNSSTHFINIFKRHFGVSPKKFRTQKLMGE